MYVSEYLGPPQPPEELEPSPIPNIEDIAAMRKKQGEIDQEARRTTVLDTVTQVATSVFGDSTEVTSSYDADGSLSVRTLDGNYRIVFTGSRSDIASDIAPTTYAPPTEAPFNGWRDQDLKFAFEKAKFLKEGISDELLASDEFLDQVVGLTGLSAEYRYEIPNNTGRDETSYLAQELENRAINQTESTTKDAMQQLLASLEGESEVITLRDFINARFGPRVPYKDPERKTDGIRINKNQRRAFEARDKRKEEMKEVAVLRITKDQKQRTINGKTYAPEELTSEVRSGSEDGQRAVLEEMFAIDRIEQALILRFK